jgi:type IV pilus assembly protein PilOP
VNEKLKNPKVAIGAAVAGGLLLALAGWFLLVSPARSKSADLATQIQSTQSEITTRRAAIAAKPKIQVDVRSSDLFRLTKAVPGRPDMPGIVLELNRLASGTGVTFNAITPSPVVAAQGYNVLPLSVIVNGRFGELNTFLNRLRKLVTVRKGRLDASGRLFAIDNVEVAESAEAKFPKVQATITLDAFVYAGGKPAAADPNANPTDTSAPPASGAVAAGATS